MIRPSQLQIAEACGLAPFLAAAHPETSAAAERGTELHEQIARALTANTDPIAAEARAAVEWARAMKVGALARAEHKVRLEDPETGELLTEGTADLLIVRDNIAIVVDWKSGDLSRVPHPDDNLQLHAYGLAAALELGAHYYQPIIVGIAADIPDVREGAVVSDFWPMLERIRKAVHRKPEASVGPHCATSCWSRKYCAAWTLPVHEGPSALEPFTGGPLDAERAGRGVLLVQAMREMADRAEEHLRAYVRENGPIVLGDREWGLTVTAGRRSGPSVEECERQGLKHLIREGRPSERWAWRKVRAGGTP